MRKVSVFAIIKRRDKWLMAKRSKRVNNPGLWGFFGGTVDKGETPKKALTREIEEEAGLKVRNAIHLKTIQLPNKTLEFWEVQVRVAKPKLNKEHSNFKWMKFKDATSKKLHLPAKLFFKKVKEDRKLSFKTTFKDGQYRIKAYNILGEEVASARVSELSKKLCNFKVEAQFRGKGYADLLMDHIMKSSNAPTQLVAKASNGSTLSGASLINFYTKHGFVFIGGTNDNARMQRV